MPRVLYSCLGDRSCLACHCTMLEWSHEEPLSEWQISPWTSQGVRWLCIACPAYRGKGSSTVTGLCLHKPNCQIARTPLITVHNLQDFNTLEGFDQVFGTVHESNERPTERLSSASLLPLSCSPHIEHRVSEAYICREVPDKVTSDPCLATTVC